MRGQHVATMLVTLGLLCSPAATASVCEPNPSASGALDAKWLRFYLGNGFLSNDPTTNAHLQQAAREGAKLMNPNWCRGNPGGFAYAYEGWGPRGFDPATSRYTISIVLLQGSGTSCMKFDPSVSKVYVYERRNGFPNRMCPSDKIAWDVANGKNPNNTGSFMDFANMLGHEVGHGLGLGDKNNLPQCFMGPMEKKSKNFQKVWAKHVGPTPVECAGLDRISNSLDEIVIECLNDPDCEIDPPNFNGSADDMNEGKGPGLNIPDINFVDITNPKVVPGPGRFDLCFSAGGIIICIEL